MKKKNHLKLVQTHGKKLTTTSLVVAEVFGRRHFDVIKALKGLAERGKISDISRSSFTYLDTQNREQTAYELSERDFLIAMPFIGGEKSEDGQVRLVDEFLRIHRLLNQQGRKEALQYKRDTARPMTDCLTYIRSLQGKETKGMPHCSNTHLFCNRALTGEWKPIDESALDAYDANLLAKIRERNTVLIAMRLSKKDHVTALDKFVEDHMAKNPKVMLIEEPKPLYFVG